MKFIISYTALVWISEDKCKGKGIPLKAWSGPEG